MKLNPRIWPVLGCICFPFFVFAQRAQLSGTVFDSADEALPFANITLNDLADSSLVKVGVTDEDGQFSLFGIDAGEYWLEVTFVGMSTLKENVTLEPGEKKTLEELKMPEAHGTDLDEVVVAAKRPLIELKGDKMIFNVENSINATGSNGLELLRKSPGVLVDNNNNITMLGRPGVRIFINGKPSPLRGAELASYLESVQSTSIDAIEIITNPGSKYEAEGNAGIINIRLKKEAGLGANGNFNLGYAVGIKPRYNAGVSGNYRNKWMNIYGSYNLTKNYWLTTMIFDRRQYQYVYDQRNYVQGNGMPQNFKAGADFFVSKKSTLGILVEGGHDDNSMVVDARTTLGTVGFPDPDSLLLAGQESEAERFNLNYNLNYLWQIKKDASLTIDANYGTFSFDRWQYQPNYYTDLTGENILSQSINENITPTDIEIQAVKVDYESPFWKGKLGAGLKYSRVNTQNDFQYYDIIGEERNINIDRSNFFAYDENVNAAYFNFSRKFGKTLNFQVGLRVEETRSSGQLEAMKPVDNEQVDRSYLDWFPSASLNITASEDNQIQLSYSRRINRPAYESLNPFEWKLDELSFHRGNPFLQPEYSNIFQIRHSFKYKVNTTISYSHTTDMMALQIQAGEGKVGYRTWLNLPDQHNYSINIAAPTPVTDWWNSMISLTAYHRRNKGDFGEGKVIDLKVSAFNVYTQQTFNLSEKISFEISGFYNSPTVYQASMQAKSQWSMDMGLKMPVLNGSGNLTVALSDVFRTNRFLGEIHFGDFDFVVRNRGDRRRLKVNFSYLFGNSKVKRARNRKTGLDEEKRRTQ